MCPGRRAPPPASHARQASFLQSYLILTNLSKKVSFEEGYLSIPRITPGDLSSVLLRPCAPTTL
eukprot:scaffold866_cov116-Skeletonema_dohrnii-CCMP3373.AAC.4